jgi:hypothetical protein
MKFLVSHWRQSTLENNCNKLLACDKNHSFVAMIAKQCDNAFSTYSLKYHKELSNNIFCKVAKKGQGLKIFSGKEVNLCHRMTFVQFYSLN